jgi:hypothetical protein
VRDCWGKAWAKKINWSTSLTKHFLPPSPLKKSAGNQRKACKTTQLVISETV